MMVVDSTVRGVVLEWDRIEQWQTLSVRTVAKWEMN